MMVDHEFKTGARLKDMMTRASAPGTPCTVGLSGAKGHCPLAPDEPQGDMPQQFGHATFFVDGALLFNV